MGLQTLSYYGYIHVDHVKIKADIEGMLDMNDDGRIDHEDGSMAMKKIMEVMAFGMPSGSGFAAGFVGGLRSG